MARACLSRIAREYSSLLHHGCAVSDGVFGGRSFLLTACVRVCRGDCAARAGSILRLAGVPSISGRQTPRRRWWLVAGRVLSRTRSAASGDDVAYLCSGSISRTDWIDCVPSIHSRSRSRPAGLVRGEKRFSACLSPPTFHQSRERKKFFSAKIYERIRTRPVFRFFTNPFKGNGCNACPAGWETFSQGVNGRA